jgi:predicted phosphate transport protein (TIGR00153 family)
MDWKRERKLISLFEKLMKTGEKAEKEFNELFVSHIDNLHGGTFHFGIDSLNKTESEADDIVHEITTVIHSLAIPSVRDDLIVFADRFDSIIDEMLHLMVHISNRKVHPCSALLDLYKELLSKSSYCVAETISLVRIFFEKHNNESLIAHVEKVCLIETECDVVEDRLIETLFLSEATDSGRIIESTIISQLGNVANRCEDLADHIAILNLKMAE